MKSHHLIYTSSYFFILLLIATQLTPPILDWGVTKPNAYVYFSSTINDIKNAFGSADPRSFADGSLYLLNNGWFKGDDIWYINLWPPGFFVLEYVLLRIFGEHSPLVGILQILSALCLAVSLNLFRNTLTRYCKPILATSLPLLPLLSPQFSYSMLGPQYIVYGEPFAISFFMIGTFLLISSLNKTNYIIAIFSGTAFALSAYFRPQFEFFIMVATALFIVITLGLTFKSLIWKCITTHRSQPTKIAYSNIMTITMISLIAFHALTIPYKIYNHKRNHTYMWVISSNLALRANFTPFNATSPHIMNFHGKNGANVACQIDQTKCADIYDKITHGEISNKELKKVLLQTFLLHPGQWIKLKLHYLPKFWFANLETYQEANDTPSSSSLLYINLFDYMFIICIFSSLLWFGLTRKYDTNLVLFWQSTTILISYIIIFIIAHYETRYLYFIKFYFLYMALFSLSQIINELKKIGLKSKTINRAIKQSLQTG